MMARFLAQHGVCQVANASHLALGLIETSLTKRLLTGAILELLLALAECRQPGLASKPGCNMYTSLWACSPTFIGTHPLLIKYILTTYYLATVVGAST